MDRATITYLEQRYRYYGVTSPHGVKRRHRLADHANSGSGRHTEHGGGFSAVQPLLRASHGASAPLPAAAVSRIAKRTRLCSYGFRR